MCDRGVREMGGMCVGCVWERESEMCVGERKSKMCVGERGSEMCARCVGCVCKRKGLCERVVCV